MKLTNESGLHPIFVELADKLLNEHPDAQPNKFFVTELAKSEKQIVLQRRHEHEIERDVQRACALIEGTAFHSLLEEIAKKHPDKYISEKRIEMELAPGITISGQFDMLDKETWEIIDYKNTKMAAIDKAESGNDWKWFNQAMIYSILIGHEFNDKPRPIKARFLAMAKDHSFVKASSDPSYPKYPMREVVFDLSDPVEAGSILEAYRYKAIRVKELLENGLEPNECTYDDMWCTEDWAIMKPDAKKAHKCFDNPDKALEYYMSLDESSRDKMRIYHRISDATNCKAYCPCAEFCEQGKKARDMEKIVEDVTDAIIPF